MSNVIEAAEVNGSRYNNIDIASHGIVGEWQVFFYPQAVDIEYNFLAFVYFAPDH